MKPMNIGTKILMGIEVVLASKGDKKLLADADEALTKYLRGNGDDPAWELFPLARNWYTQRS